MLERIASWSVFDVDTSLIEDGARDLISFFLKKSEREKDGPGFLFGNDFGCVSDSGHDVTPYGVVIWKVSLTW